LAVAETSGGIYRPWHHGHAVASFVRLVLRRLGRVLLFSEIYQIVGSGG